MFFRHSVTWGLILPCLAGLGSDMEPGHSAQPPAPTLAQVADSHPGVKLVTNKLKKSVRSKLAGLTQDFALQDFVLEAVMAVHSVFDSSFMDAALSMLNTVDAINGDEDDAHATLSDTLLGVPALASHRKLVKAIVQAFGNRSNNAQFFVMHRAVSWQVIGHIGNWTSVGARVVTVFALVYMSTFQH